MLSKKIFKQARFLVHAVLSTYVASSFSLGSMASAAQAQPQTPATDLDYGEMYVVQKHEAPANPWEASLSYTYGFSNPYIGIHGVSLGLNRQVGEFALIGVSGSYFAITNSDVLSDIEKNLGVQGVSALVSKPEYSSYVNFGLIPLSGLLNWFGKKSFNFDLVVGVGGGIAGYHNHTSVLASFRGSLTPKLMINQNFGLTAGLITTWDRFAGNDWQNRVDTMFGVLVRF